MLSFIVFLKLGTFPVSRELRRESIFCGISQTWIQDPDDFGLTNRNFVIDGRRGLKARSCTTAFTVLRETPHGLCLTKKGDRLGRGSRASISFCSVPGETVSRRIATM